MKGAIRKLYAIYAICTFVLLLLLLFVPMLLASLGGALEGGNRIYRLCSFWADAWFVLLGIRHENVIEAAPPQSAVIFVANHRSYLDSPVIVKTLRRPVRVLGKIEMGKIPLFGFVYKRVVVSVDRSSPENRANSMRNMRSVLSKGISIFVFPEGTFNEGNMPTKTFYDGAFRLAIETGTPIVPLLFVDSSVRMPPDSVMSINPGQNRVVYLPSIDPETFKDADVEVFREEVRRRMDEGLRRWKAAWIKE